MVKIGKNLDVTINYNIQNNFMTLQFRFAIASDLHIGLPHTVLTTKRRFHLVEASTAAFDATLNHLQSLDLDFLLLPGDLTQHGEPENHTWLQQRLSLVPFPVYVVPGNHDIPTVKATEKTIAFADFPHYYQKFGYENPHQHDYTKEILPGVQLVALNSNEFTPEGEQFGYINEAQLAWLEGILASNTDKLIMLMLHHNVIEHLPNQSNHPLGKRYMLSNSPTLLTILRKYGVKLIFTGHLHVQDIAQNGDIYEITTGSLVSYPHPYRVLELHRSQTGEIQLKVTSHRLQSIPGWENLSEVSRERLGDTSAPFMMKLLTEAPLNLPVPEAEKLAPKLRYFWADIAAGDALLDFADFPPVAKQYFENFSAIAQDGTYQPIDNHTVLALNS